MEHLKINIYSHHFSCNPITSTGVNICESFKKSFQQYIPKNMKKENTPEVYFCVFNKEKTEYRFHINSLQRFKHILVQNNLSAKNLLVITHELKEPTKIEFNVNKNFTPREEQIDGINYLANQDNKFKLLQLQTGKGKTLSSMFALEKLLMRVAIIVRPQFMKMWEKELIEKTDLVKSDILLIQGVESLLALLSLAKENKIDEKAIIISNKTLQNYFKMYEEYGEDILEMGYGCLPHEMYEVLDVGVRLIDEVHFDLHLQMKIDLYTHCKNIISLSATMLSGNSFIEKIQYTLYPDSCRYKGGVYDKYIHAIAVMYNIENIKFIRTTEYGHNGYSHIAFEKSILRNKRLTDNYFKLIDRIISNFFIPLKREKKKLAVYASSIQMCTKLAEFFSDKYPLMDIKRYCENDPRENLMDSDIRFTTIQSAGTGHDIKDLTTVILTNAISSVQSNIQVMGRLRKLPDDHKVEFYYFACMDIRKQMEYKLEKDKLLRTRCLSVLEYNSNITL